MSEYEAKFVKCPYYLEGTHTYQLRQNQIRCEGITKDTTISLIFISKQLERAYRTKYCNDIKGCKQCRIHKTLEAKWGEQSKNE